MSGLFDTYSINVRLYWLMSKGNDWWTRYRERLPLRCSICGNPNIDFPKHKDLLITQYDSINEDIYLICKNHGYYLDKEFVFDALTGESVEIYPLHRRQVLANRWLSEGYYWAFVLSRFIKLLSKEILFYPVWLIHKWTHKIERWMFGG